MQMQKKLRGALARPKDDASGRDAQQSEGPKFSQLTSYEAKPNTRDNIFPLFNNLREFLAEKSKRQGWLLCCEAWARSFLHTWISR